MPTLLVVDDNDSIRRLVRKILDRMGYEAEEAVDGIEAIEKLRTGTYDGVMLDLMMPRADGFAVLKFMEEERPEVLRSTIVLTADSARWGDASLSRVHNVVKKPFTLDHLIPIIESCCGSGKSA